MLGDSLIDNFKLFFLSYKNTVIVWPTVNKKWCGLILCIATITSTQHEIHCLISLYRFAAGKITNTNSFSF